MGKVVGNFLGKAFEGDGLETVRKDLQKWFGFSR